MSERPILELPDPRLREASAPVDAFDSALGTLIDDLFDTLYSAGGIGLCAPQVGELRQVLVMDLSDDRSQPQVFINPRLLTRATPGIVEESCLSVPGVKGNVIRSTQVRVRAQDRAGQPVEQDLQGMHAVCVQHEMDHLAGTLFIDRLFLLRRLWLRRTLGKEAFRRPPQALN